MSNTESMDATATLGRGRELVRLGGLSALTCTVVHAVLVLLGGASELSMTTPMFALSLLCLPCGWRLTRCRGHLSDVSMLILGAFAMLALHALMHRGTPVHQGMGRHQMTGSAFEIAMRAGVSMTIALLVVLVVSVTMAAWTRRTR